MYPCPLWVYVPNTPPILPGIPQFPSAGCYTLPASNKHASKHSWNSVISGFRVYHTSAFYYPLFAALSHKLPNIPGILEFPSQPMFHFRAQKRKKQAAPAAGFPPSALATLPLDVIKRSVVQRLFTSPYHKYWYTFRPVY